MKCCLCVDQAIRDETDLTDAFEAVTMAPLPMQTGPQSATLVVVPVCEACRRKQLNPGKLLAGSVAVQ